ncbi:succinate dehydrogenase flavin-adding protein (antitoxin of CptAB toxin-antitoxin module) [Chitinivorax tropicus]|uniref:FAD assembly factor SdhE n=1 Tax=Chitinivorax tropicus TaxID=714531 RepID=A0A840MUM1_9PROT|nr:succinate dehydrogenase assembly factor 2 [Chitinivorax tropicus]MBB5020023.1 succinate dehydrogenase flavin-adding protein (antitoxin of CptAB toxin-antitoxin module) [Chitinivorax tropicus]
MSDLDRIRWRSRRGLLELDLMLEKFLAQWLDKLSPEELESYKDLLFLPDNDLLDLANGIADHPDEHIQAILQKIRDC